MPLDVPELEPMHRWNSSQAGRPHDYPFAGSDCVNPTPRSTHFLSCRAVPRSSASTRSQPGIGRPRMTATDAAVVATN